MFSPSCRSATFARLALLAALAGAPAACGAPAGERPAEGSAAAAGAPPRLQDAAAGDPTRHPAAAAGRDSTPAPDAGPVTATDFRGTAVRLDRPARRVVSLVPAGTDLLVALGVVDRVVGRTRYDTASAIRGAVSVGGGLDPSVEALLALHPDVVLVWASANDRGLGARLRAGGVPTFALRLEDTTAVFQATRALGTLLGRDAAAEALAGRLRGELAAVAADSSALPVRPRVLWVGSVDPPSTAGPRTFAMQVIGVAGGRPALPDLAQDWPQISMEEVVSRQPDVLVLPIGETRTSVARLAAAPGWRDLAAVRAGRVILVDADLASRPGPTLGRAARAIHDSLRAVLARHPL